MEPEQATFERLRLFFELLFASNEGENGRKMKILARYQNNRFVRLFKRMHSDDVALIFAISTIFLLILITRFKTFLPLGYDTSLYWHSFKVVTHNIFGVSSWTQSFMYSLVYPIFGIISTITDLTIPVQSKLVVALTGLIFSLNMFILSGLYFSDKVDKLILIFSICFSGVFARVSCDLYKEFFGIALLPLGIYFFVAAYKKYCLKYYSLLFLVSFLIFSSHSLVGVFFLFVVFVFTLINNLSRLEKIDLSYLCIIGALIFSKMFSSILGVGSPTTDLIDVTFPINKIIVYVGILIPLVFIFHKNKFNFNVMLLKPLILFLFIFGILNILVHPRYLSDNFAVMYQITLSPLLVIFFLSSFIPDNEHKKEENQFDSILFLWLVIFLFFTLIPLQYIKVGTFPAERLLFFTFFLMAFRVPNGAKNLMESIQHNKISYVITLIVIVVTIFLGVSFYAVKYLNMSSFNIFLIVSKFVQSNVAITLLLCGYLFSCLIFVLFISIFSKKSKINKSYSGAIFFIFLLLSCQIALVSSYYAFLPTNINENEYHAIEWVHNDIPRDSQLQADSPYLIGSIAFYTDSDPTIRRLTTPYIKLISTSTHSELASQQLQENRSIYQREFYTEMPYNANKIYSNNIVSLYSVT